VAVIDNGQIWTLTSGGRNCSNNMYLPFYKRRMLPIEAFRIMGVDQINIEGIPKTALFKIAGNAWEIKTVTAIMKALFD